MEETTSWDCSNCTAKIETTKYFLSRMRVMCINPILECKYCGAYVQVMTNVTPENLFCKQCRAPKYVERDDCCYCVGRYFIAKDTFRNRLAYRLMSPQRKLWYAFQVGLDKCYPSLIPEHLRKGEWLDIEEINRPIVGDER